MIFRIIYNLSGFGDGRYCDVIRQISENLCMYSSRPKVIKLCKVSLPGYLQMVPEILGGTVPKTPMDL